MEKYFLILLNCRQMEMSSWLKQIENHFVKPSLKGAGYYKFKFYKDDPQDVSDRVIYIVGERQHYWKLCFRCPCGCNEVISLNLLKQANPRWRFIIRWRRITIYPSIWRKIGCKSHFHIRKGKVDWSFT